LAKAFGKNVSTVSAKPFQSSFIVRESLFGHFGIELKLFIAFWTWLLRLGVGVKKKFHTFFSPTEGNERSHQSIKFKDKFDMLMAAAAANFKF
jgi:hypothetical protein